MMTTTSNSSKTKPVARFSVGQAVTGYHLRKTLVAGNITHIFDLGFDSWLVVNVGNGTLLNIETDTAEVIQQIEGMAA